MGELSLIALLQNYSLQDIFICIIFIALAVKSLISFLDWAYDYIRKIFNFKHYKINEKEELHRRLQKGSEVMSTLEKNQKATDEVLDKLSTKIDMLIDSDKDAIKSFITEKHHHYCYKVGYIDDFSLDCIEKRFKHYSDQGGNSFIENFMKELRALPIRQPTQKQ